MNKIFLFSILILIACHDTGIQPEIVPDPDPVPITDSIADFVWQKLGDGVFKGNIIYEEVYYDHFTMLLNTVHDTFINQMIVLDSVYKWENHPNFHIFKFSTDLFLFDKWVVSDSTILSEGIFGINGRTGNDSWEHSCNLKQKSINTYEKILAAPNPGYRSWKGYFKK